MYTELVERKMFTDRQQKIFKLIVDNYITHAQAISSDALVEALDVSSATIRNEMYDMTANGFLIQPHTSAGRIPSAKGWQYYVESFMKTDKKLSKKERSELESIINSTQDNREKSKQIAKLLAKLASAAIMIAYKPRDMYYTGLTNLFSQPEFHELQSVVHISQVIDHLDDVMLTIFDSIDDVGVAVGQENPFSPECSIVIGSIDTKDGKWVMGILGPMRMNYDHNFALLKTVRELLTK